MQTDVLQLTGIIQPGELPNIYTGRIKEIGGILAQGTTEDEAYSNLLETTKHMIEVYKRAEALQLLATQNRGPVARHRKTEDELPFRLERELVH